MKKQVLGVRCQVLANAVRVCLLLAGTWNLTPNTCFSQPAYTLISDSLPNGANGLPVMGTINVSWTEFTYGPYTIAPSPLAGVNYPITNGAVSMQLAATDHATVPVTYTIVTTVGSKSITTYWSVPTLPNAQCANAGFCRINEVTVSFPAGPSLAINVSQISTGQSSHGQMICNENSIAGWGTPTPVEAPTLGLGTVMFFNELGQLDSVIGAPGNCVYTDGTSGPCGGPIVWGDIGGTLSNQSDLATALGMKLTAANNLSDLASATTARANLGLGTAATQPSSAFQAALGFTPENTANKDQPSGYAGLDSSGKLKPAEAPQWNQNTTGTAATATALAATPSQCGSGLVASGVAANGNANCFSIPNTGPTSSSGYTQTFSGVTSVVITHNFNSFAVTFACFDNASPPNWILPKSVQLTSANAITVTFASAQSGQCNVVY